MPDILQIAVALESAVLFGLLVLWGLKRMWLWWDRRTMYKAQRKFAQEQTLTGVYRTRVSDLETKNQDLLDEVQRLIKRNMMMARELRNDPKAPTEFLPMGRSGRFMASDLRPEPAEGEPPALPGQFTRGL